MCGSAGAHTHKNSSELGELWKNHAVWFRSLGPLRDALIHHQSLPVFIPYAKTRVVHDYRPVAVRIVDGEERFYFDLDMGTRGMSPQESFMFKGREAVARWKVGYVMPKSIVRHSELSDKGKLTFDDFQGVLSFCRSAFARLRDLSEIAFHETLNEITR